MRHQTYKQMYTRVQRLPPGTHFFVQIIGSLINFFTLEVSNVYAFATDSNETSPVY